MSAPESSLYTLRADQEGREPEYLPFAMPRHWAEDKAAELNARYAPLRRYSVVNVRDSPQ
jgi:hypothetical protein